MRFEKIKQAKFDQIKPGCTKEQAEVKRRIRCKKIKLGVQENKNGIIQGLNKNTNPVHSKNNQINLQIKQINSQ